MKRSMGFGLMLLLPLFGCFQTLDLEADRIFGRAIQDQRSMAVQDQQADIQRLLEAKIRGLQLIKDKRTSVGKSLEGLMGPSGKPLLDWETSEMINIAFSELEATFLKAVSVQEAIIDIKYEDRVTPMRVCEAYLVYTQTRRHVGAYAMDAFLREMTEFDSVGGGVGLDDLSGILQEARKAGLPTSLDEIWAWLQGEAQKKIASIRD